MKAKQKINYILFAPFITLGILLVLYAINGVYPFGGYTTAVGDGLAQYLPFLSEFAYKIKEGGSLFFTWHAGHGVNFWANFAYYLASPFNFIALFFKPENMDNAFSLITLLKPAFMALTFGIYLKHAYKKNDLSIVIFSVLWSLSSFVLSVSFLTTWIDALIYFPLVVLGLKRLMDGYSGWMYSIFLGLTIASNFYIGYIVCIFCVIYFVYSLISDDEIVYEGATGKSEPEESEETSINIFEVFKNSYLIKTGLRFALASALGGALTAILSLPTILALSNTGKGETAPGSVIQDIWNTLSSHVFPLKNIYETFTSTDVSFCFVGILSVILACTYFFTKGISIRKKIGNFFLLAVMWISMCVYGAYIVWHAFSVPAGLMQRFAFVYAFIILKIAYECFMNIDKIRPVGVVVGVAFSAICVVGIKLSDLMNKHFYSAKLVITLAVFIVLYSIVILLVGKKKDFKKIGTTIIVASIIVEIIVLNVNNLFIDNWKNDIKKSKTINDVITNIEDYDYIQYQMKNQSFRDNVMYGLWYGYNSNDYYSSLADFNYVLVQNLVGSYGNAFNNENGTQEQTPIANIIFPVKYFLDEQGYVGETQFRKLIKSENGKNLFENNYTMPFMYTVPYSIENWHTFNYPIATDFQNAAFKAYTGTNENVITLNSNSNYSFDNCKKFSYVQSMQQMANDQGVIWNNENDEYYQLLDDKMAAYTVKINDKNKDAYVTFTSTAESDGIQYIYVETTAFTEMKIEVNGETREYYTYGIGENRTYELGEVKKGDTIKVTIGGHKHEAGETSAYNSDGETFAAMCFTVDMSVFEEGYQKLDAMSDTEMLDFEDTYVKAKVTSYEDGMLYIPTAYDEGWTITIDGEEVPLYEHESHILMTEISKGEHIVEMKYVPQGFIPGAVITGVSVLILIAWAVISTKRFKKEQESDIIVSNDVNEE